MNGRALSTVMLLLLVPACSKPQAPGTNDTAASGNARDQAVLDAQVVATVGEDALSLKSFERYLADNSGDDSDQDADQANDIKSRLLDQMIEEKVLEQAGKGLGITVSESEVGDYLGQIGVSEGEADVAGEGKEAFRDKVRQSLMLQKVKDKAVLSKVEVTPGEVDDYLKKQADTGGTPRSVVLRQILIDDKSLANRLSAQLEKDPTQFEKLARENSGAPDKGQARPYTEDNLPVEIRNAAFALEPGKVSPVIDYMGNFLIVQLVQKMDAQAGDPASDRRRAQIELFRKKGEQALDRYIADLKKDTKIHVNRAALPFDYTGEYKN